MLFVWFDRPGEDFVGGIDGRFENPQGDWACELGLSVAVTV